MPEENEYDLAPEDPKPQSKDPRAPGFVPPEPIVEKAEEGEAAEPSAAEKAERDAARADAEAHRSTAMVAYIPGCFVVPLLFAHRSRFARYHANQGLLLFCYFLFVWVVIVGAWLPGVGDSWFPGLHYFWSILSILGCFADTLAVLGLIGLMAAGVTTASACDKRPLPVIGNVVLIKEEA